MCPASATRYLTEDDLSGRTAWQLTIMRNEIYARHGRPFVVDYIREYFQSQSWYRADPSYTDTRLNSVEERNAGFILDYQNRHNLRYERGQDRLGEG
jgi:hypothetical protein